MQNKLIPRRMWLYTRGDTGVPTEPWSVSPQRAAHTFPAKPDIPVLVIPLTKEAIKRLDARVADISFVVGLGNRFVLDEKDAREILSAIGIKVPRTL